MSLLYFVMTSRSFNRPCWDEANYFGVKVVLQQIVIHLN